MARCVKGVRAVSANPPLRKGMPYDTDIFYPRKCLESFKPWAW
jgi:hypothetical protein